MAGWCHDARYAFAPTQLDHADVGGVILSDAGASFADAVRSHGDPDVPTMSDLLLIVNTADVGAMLSVLRRELEMRGVSLADAERAGVERVDAVDTDAADREGIDALEADDAGAEDTVDSL